MDVPVRQRMIVGMISLLSRQGYAATTLADVLQVAEAPRGSIYHYFPDGKDQLVRAAVGTTLDAALDGLESMRGLDLDTILGLFAAGWRNILERTDAVGGCAIMAVSVGADKADLRALASDAFTTWEARLAEILQSAGIDEEIAATQAQYLLASYEGAVLLARAHGSLATFDAVDTAVRRSVLAVMSRQVVFDSGDGRAADGGVVPVVIVEVQPPR